MTCWIRYRAVARLKLSHFCCADTTPRVGCLCNCPFCVTVTLTTCALVTLNIDCVCTVQQSSFVSNTYMIEQNLPVPSPSSSRLTRGRLNHKHSAVAITLGTLYCAACRWLGKDWGRGWSNSPIESPFLKRLWVRKSLIRKPSVPGFSGPRGGRSR
jgi:hypothetical protein